MIGSTLWVFALAAVLQLQPPPPPLPPPPPRLLATPPQQDPASIEGVVLDGNTNMPLANVMVSRDGALFSSAGAADNLVLEMINGSSGSVLTDAEGRFVLEGINPATATIAARKAGYVNLHPTDINGGFELQAAPGAYRLYSWTELDGAAYRNEEFMKKYDGLGTPVRIEKDGKVVAHLNLVDEMTGR